MADQAQNFTDMFKKFGEQMKVPSFDMTKIMEHQQKNLEAMTKSWQAMAGGASEIAQRQKEIFEAAMKDMAEMAQSYKPGGNPQEVIAKQAEFAKKAMEAAIANTKDIAELVQEVEHRSLQDRAGADEGILRRDPHQRREEVVKAFRAGKDHVELPNNGLTLRSVPQERVLEGWTRAPRLLPILRDAALREAPQDEEEILLPAPVREDEALPAGAIELLPLAFGLGEAVGDRIDGRRMMAEATVAAIALDVLDLLALVVDAGLPGADSVSSAEHRRRRHGRRFCQRPSNVLVAVLDVLARGEFIDAPGIWSPWGCRQRDCRG